MAFSEASTGYGWGPFSARPSGPSRPGSGACGAIFSDQWQQPRLPLGGLVWDLTRGRLRARPAGEGGAGDPVAAGPAPALRLMWRDATCFGGVRGAFAGGGFGCFGEADEGRSGASSGSAEGLCR